MTIQQIIKKPAALASLVGLIANLITWIITLTQFPQNESVAILHYNASVGVDFIGKSDQLKTVPTIGTALLIGNIIIALCIRKSSAKAVVMFWGIIPCIEIILLTAVLLIVHLNQ